MSSTITAAQRRAREAEAHEIKKYAQQYEDLLITRSELLHKIQREIFPSNDVDKIISGQRA